MKDFRRNFNFWREFSRKRDFCFLGFTSILPEKVKTSLFREKSLLKKILQIFQQFSQIKILICDIFVVFRLFEKFFNKCFLYFTENSSFEVPILRTSIRGGKSRFIAQVKKLILDRLLKLHHYCIISRL